MLERTVEEKWHLLPLASTGIETVVKLHHLLVAVVTLIDQTKIATIL